MASLVEILPPTPPVAVLKTFTRACNHEQRMLHTPGDAAQAARYEATACAACRPATRKFGRGRGGSQ